MIISVFRNYRTYAVRNFAFDINGARAIFFAFGILFASPFIPSTTSAQTLDQALQTLLSGSCAALVGPPTAQLATYCNTSPSPAVGEASTGGGAGVSPAVAGFSPERIKEDGDGGSGTGGSVKISEKLGIFLSFDGRSEDKDVTPFEDGYDSIVYSGTVGLDFEISNNLVVGGGFNYINQGADFTRAGGFDSKTYGGFVFASLALDNGFFADVFGGYAVKDTSNSRTVLFTNATNGAALRGNIVADTDADEFSFSASGGYDFAFGSVTVGPRVALDVRHTEIDAYSESGITGLEMRVSEQEDTSVQSRVGVRGSVAISTGFGVLVPEASADYIHEFYDDQRHISASLVQDTGNTSFRFQNEKPDRDFFELGVGAVVVLPNGLQPFARFSGTVGHSYLDTYGGNVGIRFKL